MFHALVSESATFLPSLNHDRQQSDGRVLASFLSATQRFIPISHGFQFHHWDLTISFIPLPIQIFYSKVVSR
jgi:hypothetical protein